MKAGLGGHRSEAEVRPLCRRPRNQHMVQDPQSAVRNWSNVNGTTSRWRAGMWSQQRRAYALGISNSVHWNRGLQLGHSRNPSIAWPQTANARFILRAGLPKTQLKKPRWNRLPTFCFSAAEPLAL